MSNLWKTGVVSVLLSIFLTACGRKDTAVSAATVERPAASPDVVEATPDQMKALKTSRATLQTIPTTEDATGKVGFNEDATTFVFTPYAGRVVELKAKPGDSIVKGAPLLIIDSPEVVDAQNDFLTGRAALAKAQAGVAKAEVILRQAGRTRDRIQALKPPAGAPLKDLEQALTDFESATNDLESAKTDIRAAEAQIDSARQRLLNFGKSQTEIDQLAETRHIDRTTRVMAPIGGLIVGRKVGPGQYIRPDNPDPLFTVADTSTMWLLAQVYESQVPLVRVGDRVEVRVLALANQVFPAKVAYIASTLDPATRRVAVRCVVQNRNNQLKPEMFASFRFEKAPRQAILVPQKAVVREDNIAVVWVVKGGNRIARRPVELGAERDGSIEIKSGLAAGDIVVADGALFLSSFVKG